MTSLSPSQELTRDLIRCPSVTPAEGGALDLMEAKLTEAGFTCHRLPFGYGDERIDNLFAYYGDGQPHFCFAGHTDVVPAGDNSSWRHDPFGGNVEDGKIFGRGAVDMKGAIASFTIGAMDWIAEHKDGFDGRISLLITGDEEGDAKALMHSALNLRKIIKEHRKINPWQFTDSFSLEKSLSKIYYTYL